MSEALERWLDERRAFQITFLQKLIAQASDNPPGDLAAAALACAHDLQELGLEVERHPVPAETVRSHAMTSATNLIVRHRFGPGPTLALNAHGDAVPPGDGWTRDPHGGAVIDGWLYGRGAAVSKSDIAAYTFALLALREAGKVDRGTVELHVTWDEEAGGAIGPAWLLEEGLSRPDLVVCAGFPYSVVTAQGGGLHLEVEVLGRAAHAATPAAGIDALDAARHVLNALYAERPKLQARASAVPGIGSPQLTVGSIQAGISASVVADRVSLRLDRRLIPEENGAEVEARLTRLIEAAVGNVPGGQVSVRRLLLAEPLQETSASRRLGEALALEASAVLGEPVELVGGPLYSDARHYAAAGIPTVLFGAGPRTREEANAGRADERVPIRELHLATLALARTLQKLLAA